MSMTEFEAALIVTLNRIALGLEGRTTGTKAKASGKPSASRADAKSVSGGLKSIADTKGEWKRITLTTGPTISTKDPDQLAQVQAAADAGLAMTLTYTEKQSGEYTNRYLVSVEANGELPVEPEGEPSPF